jgi:hypothetical protein
MQPTPFRSREAVVRDGDRAGHPRRRRPQQRRKFSYARYSEGRAAHWLLLILADRVDAWESHLARKLVRPMRR